MRFQCNILHSYKLYNANKADVCFVFMIAYLVPMAITLRRAGHVIFYLFTLENQLENLGSCYDII